MARVISAVVVFLLVFAVVFHLAVTPADAPAEADGVVAPTTTTLAPAPAPPRLHQVTLESLVQEAESDGTDVVIAVEDLRTGARWDVEGDYPVSFMSAAKFPWVAMAVAESGVEETEPHAIEVFVESSNLAASWVIDLAGGLDAVNDKWHPAFGMDDSCTQSWGYDWYQGDCGAGYSYYNSADDMVTFLSSLWSQTLPGLSATEQQRILEWALLSPDVLDLTGDGLLTGYLPRGVWDSLHHKVGFFPNGVVSADIGIVDLPSATYAIAISVEGGPDEVVQQNTVARLSCEVYRNMVDPAWACNGPVSPAAELRGAE